MPSSILIAQRIADERFMLPSELTDHEDTSDSNTNEMTCLTCENLSCQASRIDLAMPMFQSILCVFQFPDQYSYRFFSPIS